MTGKTLVTFITLSFCMSMVWATISTGAALEIRQENYLYPMPLCQDVQVDTFVISAQALPTTQKKTAMTFKQQAAAASPSLFTNLVTLNFSINSSEIDPGERNKMLTKLAEGAIAKNTPLVVSGYTCQKGPEDYNIWLSNERATAVAKLLEKEGYTVIQIEGKGEMELLSANDDSSNRRVEVTVPKK